MTIFPHSRTAVPPGQAAYTLTLKGESTAAANLALTAVSAYCERLRHMRGNHFKQGGSHEDGHPSTKLIVAQQRQLHSGPLSAVSIRASFSRTHFGVQLFSVIRLALRLLQLSPGFFIIRYAIRRLAMVPLDRVQSDSNAGSAAGHAKYARH